MYATKREARRRRRRRQAMRNQFFIFRKSLQFHNYFSPFRIFLLHLIDIRRRARGSPRIMGKKRVEWMNHALRLTWPNFLRPGARSDAIHY